MSLGAGTILLLGPDDDDSAKIGSGREQRRQQEEEEAKGLVQLRVLLHGEEDELQEATLYIAEGAWLG